LKPARVQSFLHFNETLLGQGTTTTIKNKINKKMAFEAMYTISEDKSQERKK
jgi:hypothetical protein